MGDIINVFNMTRRNWPWNIFCGILLVGQSALAAPVDYLGNPFITNQAPDLRFEARVAPHSYGIDYSFAEQTAHGVALFSRFPAFTMQDRRLHTDGPWYNTNTANGHFTHGFTSVDALPNYRLSNSAPTDIRQISYSNKFQLNGDPVWWNYATQLVGKISITNPSSTCIPALQQLGYGIVSGGVTNHYMTNNQAAYLALGQYVGQNEKGTTDIQNQGVRYPIIDIELTGVIPTNSDWPTIARQCFGWIYQGMASVRTNLLTTPLTYGEWTFEVGAFWDSHRMNFGAGDPEYLDSTKDFLGANDPTLQVCNDNGGAVSMDGYIRAIWGNEPFYKRNPDGSLILNSGIPIFNDITNTTVYGTKLLLEPNEAQLCIEGIYTRAVQMYLMHHRFAGTYPASNTIRRSYLNNARIAAWIRYTNEGLGGINQNDRPLPGWEMDMMTGLYLMTADDIVYWSSDFNNPPGPLGGDYTNYWKYNTHGVVEYAVKAAHRYSALDPIHQGNFNWCWFSLPVVNENSTDGDRYYQKPLAFGKLRSYNNQPWIEMYVAFPALDTNSCDMKLWIDKGGTKSGAYTLKLANGRSYFYDAWQLPSQFTNIQGSNVWLQFRDQVGTVRTWRGDYRVSVTGQVSVPSDVDAGGTRYISPAGNNTPPYTNWATAATTIQAAINVALPGEIIQVGPGTYSAGAADSTNMVVITNSITLQASSANPADTVIDGGGTRRGVYINGAGLIEGLTVRNCRAPSGAGILATNGAEVFRCFVSRNTATNGSGGGINMSGGTIRNCVLTGNTATNSGNSADGGGIASYGATVQNCTVVSNTCSRHGGGVFQDKSAAKDNVLRNCIVYYNAAIDVVATNTPGAGQLIQEYSCSPSLPNGVAGNLIAAPQFANITATNYHLIQSSPCLNSGKTEDWMLWATDIEGTPRVRSTALDMGAYELLIPPVIASTFLSPVQTGMPPWTVSITVTEDLSIASATLWWSQNGGTWTNVAMTGGPVVYSATIAPASLSDHDQFSYWTEVVDVEDLAATNGPHGFMYSIPHAPAFINTGNTWRYLAASSAPSATWKTNTFDDTAWPAGAAPLGYGADPDVVTVLPYGADPTNKWPTYYFRKSFVVQNTQDIQALSLFYRADDGLVAYVNGNEVGRTNLGSGAISYTNLAVNVSGSQVTTNTTSSTVSAPTDDTEEYTPGGGVSLNSSDLELIRDLSTPTNQVVGLRFPSVAIPSGAHVIGASIQFACDETNGTATSLTIQGFAADNVTSFLTNSFDVSSRSRTTASVAWNPSAWLVIGEAGAPERTPDLTAVVQEIVNRPGWSQNNAMGFVITGNGTRTAVAYEGTNPAGVASLSIQWTTTSTNEQDIPRTWHSIDVNPARLVNGTNLLAIEVHQNSRASSDTYLDVLLQTESLRWTAYNDSGWGPGQTTNLITLYSPASNTVGNLVNYRSGAGLPVRLNMTTVGGTPLLVSNAFDLPDYSSARSVFSGKLDGRSYTTLGQGTLSLQVSGLTPTGRYSIVLYGTRGVASYTQRWTRATLSGVSGCANHSSPGSAISTSTNSPVVANDTTVITAANMDGKVFRYDDINPGTDGAFTVTLVPNGTDTTNAYLNAFMVGTYEPSPTPAPPQITHTGLSTQVVVAPWPVSALITNTSHVIYAQLYWNQNGGALTSIPMTGTAGVFSASIAPSSVADLDNFSYRIEAADDSGQVTTNGPYSFGYRFPSETLLISDLDGQVWRYLDDGTYPTGGWTRLTFDDTLWSTGYQSFGFGDFGGPDYTNWPTTTNVAGYAAYYYRRIFTATNLASTAAIEIRAKVDDGAAFWLNGRCIWRSELTNALGDITNSTLAAGGHEGQIQVLTVSPNLFIEGVGSNVLAVEVHQTAVSSTDIYLDLQLGKADPVMQLTTNIQSGDVWRYLDNGTNLGTNWLANNYDDSLWKKGPTPIGFSDSQSNIASVTSYGTNINQKYTTTYLRKPFYVTSRANVTSVTMNVNVDDGARIFLNGNLVTNIRLPTVASYTNFASTSPNDGANVEAVTVPYAFVRAGTNMLCVEVHQTSFTSSDLRWDAQLTSLGTMVDFNANEIPDAWENRYFGQLIDDPSADSDGDGLSDWEEYLTGTSPMDASSVFAILAATPVNGSNYITWTGGTNGSQKPYGIFYTTNFPNGPWLLRGTQSRSEGTNAWWDVTNTIRKLYYRVAATN